MTDVCQAYLPSLPVNALVYLRGVAIGLEKPALAIKDRSCASLLATTVLPHVPGFMAKGLAAYWNQDLHSSAGGRL